MRGSIRWGVSLSAIAIAMGTAQAAPVSFAIAPQPLPAALAEFSRTSGVQVSAPASLMTGRTSRGVRGSMEPEAALSSLLAGSGLVGQVERGTVVLAQAPSVSGESVELPQIDVQGIRTTPPTGVIGHPPAAFAGGQVATGARMGFLGNNSIWSTPFSQMSYTSDYIRDQQATTIYDAIGGSSAARPVFPRFSTQEILFIRGFNANSRDFAFDGLYGLNNPRRPPLEGIERLEILSGPGALMFGQPPTTGAGGIVNLIPKRADDIPLTRLTGSYMSNGTFGGAIDYGRRFGQDNAWGVRLNSSYSGGQPPVNGQMGQTGVFTLGLDYRSDRFRASGDFGYQHLVYDRQRPIYQIAAGVPIPSAPSLTLNGAQSWESGRSDHLFGLMRAEYDLAENVTAYAVFGGSTLSERFFNANPTILNTRGDLRIQGSLNDGAFENVKTAEIGVRSRFDTGPIRHSVSLALNGYWQDSGFGGANAGSPFSSNLYSPSFVSRPSTAGINIHPGRTGLSTLRSVAFADTISILDERVQLVAGFRAQDVATRTYNATTGARTAAYNSSAVSPAVGLVVRPWQPLSLYASYAEGLSVGTTAPLTAANAGQVFAPFVSRQVEVGAKLDFGTIGATLALFEITRPSSITDPNTRIFSVSGEQRNRGVEFNLFGQVRPDLRVLGGLTYLDGVLTSTAGGLLNGRQAPGVPHIQMNLGAEYDLPFARGATVNARVIHTSSQYFDQANTQSIPSWTTLDIGARYRFDWDRKPVTARFNVLNVTGNNYWQSAGQGLNLGTPRTFLFSLSLDL